MRHFHEKLQQEHGIGLGYTWVKLELQGTGLVKKGRKRGVHHKPVQQCGPASCAQIIDDAESLGGSRDFDDLV